MYVFRLQVIIVCIMQCDVIMVSKVEEVPPKLRIPYGVTESERTDSVIFCIHNYHGLGWAPWPAPTKDSVTRQNARSQC
jgi:hypothetical protein